MIFGKCLLPFIFLRLRELWITFEADRYRPKSTDLLSAQVAFKLLSNSI
jgi:hypothetical protein